MVFSTPFIAVLISFLPLLQQDDSLGPKKVNVASAGLSTKPSISRGVFAEAKLGEEVTVLGYEGTVAKIKRADGTECYIARSALVASAQYVRGPANEKEMGEMKAQGYEAGRFDPETEASYKKEKGPKMEEAFRNVDTWEVRQGWSNDKIKLGAKLEAFQKAGKLAEFSTVK
jgi:hypothetical protein